MYLIVYRCYDNKEEEACFSVYDADVAKEFLDCNPAAPDGFEDRPGYYFYEYHEKDKA
jgi:hypothetical protein